MRWGCPPQSTPACSLTSEQKEHKKHFVTSKIRTCLCLSCPLWWELIHPPEAQQPCTQVSVGWLRHRPRAVLTQISQNFPPQKNKIKQTNKAQQPPDHTSSSVHPDVPGQAQVGRALKPVAWRTTATPSKPTQTHQALPLASEDTGQHLASPSGNRLLQKLKEQSWLGAQCS